jgi:hypothetical protein
MANSHSYAEKKWKCVSIGLIVVLAAGLSFQQAFAEPKDKIILRDNGSFAYGFWYSETPDGAATYSSLFVSETSRSTDVVLSRQIYSPDGTFTDVFGFASTTEDVFDIANKLGAASLSPIEMEVQTCTFVGESYDCTFDTETIQADWTGTGDIVKTTSKSSFVAPDFKVKFRQSTLFQQATATSSIGEEDLGESNYGELGRFKSVEMQSGNL